MKENNLPSSKHIPNDGKPKQKDNQSKKGVNKEKANPNLENVANNKVVMDKDKGQSKVNNEFKKEPTISSERRKDTINTSEKVDSETLNKNEKFSKSKEKQEAVVVKKGGTGLSLLAILIALCVGGAGYYFGQQKVTEFQQKFTDLEKKIQSKGGDLGQSSSASSQSNVVSNGSNISTELTALSEKMNENNNKLISLEKELMSKEHVISELQMKLNKLNAEGRVTTPRQPDDVLFAEGNSLLNQALQKLTLDGDITTSITLLKEADKVFAKSSDVNAVEFRTAINEDIKQLQSINVVDENAIMQRLSELANSLDNLVILNSNFTATDNEKLSESIDDWKENASKTATSFLNHFVRITPRNTDSKELLAPNQDIYLRENIRLRLQIAIMAVPRQQNELYKQSLNLVASWVRSYFDTTAEATQAFLKEVDELSEQSIYIDVPTQLTSLVLLGKLSSQKPQKIYKPEIKVDKLLLDEKPVISDEKSKTPESQNEPQQ